MCSFCSTWNIWAPYRIDAHVSKNDLRVIFYVSEAGAVELLTRELPSFQETLRSIGYREVLLAAKLLRNMPQDKAEKFASLAIGDSNDDQPARHEGLIMDRNPNDSRQAVALRYEPQRGRPPKSSRKAAGYLADKILELARQRDIPIRQRQKSSANFVPPRSQ